MEFLKKHKYEIILITAIAAYIAYFTLASFARYDNFYTGRFDLGNMAQTVWNTMHGHIFELTDPNGTRQMSRLAVHADFLLILLTPFYFIWSNPKMLLLIQSIVLGFGGLFTYLLSKELTKNKLISLAFGLSFLLNPAVEYTNLYDFHAVTLATTFLIAAMYFIVKKKYAPMLIFLILAGLTKEQIWVVNALIGIYLFISHKQKALGVLLILSGAGLFYYLVWIAIPHALGSQHFALSYYSDFGSTPTSVIKNIIFSPAQTIKDILGKEQLDYIAQLLVPYGYISILAPVALIPAIPTVLISLLSNNPQLHQIYYQYSASATPFIIVATIIGTITIAKKIPAISYNVLAFLILIYTLIAAYTYGPLPLALKANTDMFKKPLADKAVVEGYLSKIPDSNSIASTNNLGSHLSQRQKIYTVPLGIDQADVVAFLKETNFSDFSEDTKAIIRETETDSQYKKIINKSNFIVFEKIK